MGEIEPKVEKEEVVKVQPKEGDEEAEDAPPPEEEDEGKKKFDPTLFDWYKVEGVPSKRLSVIFNQMQTVDKIKSKMFMGFKNLEENFQLIHQSFDEGNDRFFYCEFYS